MVFMELRRASRYVYLGLYSLQHRGQESAGIVSTHAEKLYRYANMGHVSHVFDEKKLNALPGLAAIGHNRYSTTGASFLRNAQPISVETRLGSFALAHNGNLVNAHVLREDLGSKGAIFQTTVDSEVIAHLLSQSPHQRFLDALCEALGSIKGAYSLLLLTKEALYAVRDPRGFRPLALGRREDGSHVFASETCAFDITQATYIRDVEPGELIKVDSQGIHSYFPFAIQKPSLCIFENIYFSRPDSIIFGSSVYQARKNLGRYLAREAPVDADAVVPVPDSSNVAALGYAEESGIPYTLGLIRSHYIGRTFIEPKQSIRDFGARLKYNVVASAVRGKRIILVDDSIVRGTTVKKLVKLFQAAGPKELHLRISAPPIRHPCFYGVDIPTQQELIASKILSIDEMAQVFGVDSLAYISLEHTYCAMEEASQASRKKCSPHKSQVYSTAGENKWCDACFSGSYPLDISFKKTKQEDYLYEYQEDLF